MSFTIDIARFAKNTNTSLDEATRGIKIKLFNGVIRDTRVDTGRLRGNWQTTTGAPATEEIDRLDKIEQGSDGGGAMEDVKNNVQGFTVDYLANNLKYAEVYEEKDGMVAKNVARIARIVKEESAK